MRAPSPDWIVRPAAPTDLDGLLALHQRVFGRALSREQWEWKLRLPGPTPNVWVAALGTRILAQYAAIPTRFRHRGADRTAMVSVDTMTDPELRRRGLLGSLATAAYAQWRSAGVPFVVGLPNEQWGSRTHALGWAPVSELRWWVRWLVPFGGSRSRDAFHGDRLVEDSAGLDDLWPRIADEGVVRDAAWFSWRYSRAVPAWSVVTARRGDAAVGAAAFHVDANPSRPSGLLGEVVGVDRNARRALLAGIDARLRQRGAVRAAILLQTGSELEPDALASGYLPRPSTFVVQAVDLGGGVPRAARFQGGDFDVV